MVPIQLNRYLAMHGVASRRGADHLIKAGHVTVNGRRAIPTDRVGDTDQILVKGQPINPSPSLVYYLLHKPAGYLSTVSDPQGRPTVLDLIPHATRLYPVGLLDYASEGLILLTNDGELAYRLTHPKFEVTKVYKVLVKGSPPPATINQLATGVKVDGIKTSPAQVIVLEIQSGRTWLEFTIHEGKNRQIRKMCAAVGYPVIRLIRLALGPYRLDDLAPGSWQKTQNLL